MYREFGFNDGCGYKLFWNGTADVDATTITTNDNAALYEAECVARAACVVETEKNHSFVNLFVA